MNKNETLLSNFEAACKLKDDYEEFYDGHIGPYFTDLIEAWAEASNTTIRSCVWIESWYLSANAIHVEVDQSYGADIESLWMEIPKEFILNRGEYVIAMREARALKKAKMKEEAERVVRSRELQELQRLKEKYEGQG